MVAEKDSYGIEAINTILKAMEDNRNNLAGYKDEMNDFLNSNPGLKSRFNRFFEFSNYNSEELFEIFKLICKENDYQINDNLKIYITHFFDEKLNNNNKYFGNGRFVRNFFEKALETHAHRLADQNNVSLKDLTTITMEDLKNVEID